METYLFRVSPVGMDGVWRTIEMRGDHTLEDLHTMIQVALDWEGGAFYSFFLSGEAWDESSEYTLSVETLYDEEGDEDEALSLAAWQAMDENERQALLRQFTGETGFPAEFFQDMLDQLEEMETELSEDETAGDVETTTLHSLGLHEGQEFLYLYDYSEEHHFTVRVERINAFSDPDAIYPAILDGEGEAPPEFPDRV